MSLWQVYCLKRLDSYDYAYRYTTTNGRDWVYADLDGTGNGFDPAQAGVLTVDPSSDTAAPTVPTGLRVLNASPMEIVLGWDAITGDPTLYGYEVMRSDASEGNLSNDGTYDGKQLH